MATEVIFREYKKNGIVFALFPYIIADLTGSVLSYEHLGQHDSADYDHCIKISKPAKDFQNLKAELISVGYTDLKVIKKRNYNKYLENYYKSK